MHPLCWVKLCFAIAQSKIRSTFILLVLFTCCFFSMLDNIHQLYPLVRLMTCSVIFIWLLMLITNYQTFVDALNIFTTCKILFFFSLAKLKNISIMAMTLRIVYRSECSPVFMPFSVSLSLSLPIWCVCCCLNLKRTDKLLLQYITSRRWLWFPFSNAVYIHHSQIERKFVLTATMDLPIQFW